MFEAGAHSRERRHGHVRERTQRAPSLPSLYLRSPSLGSRGPAPTATPGHAHTSSAISSLRRSPEPEWCDACSNDILGSPFPRSICQERSSCAKEKHVLRGSSGPRLCCRSTSTLGNASKTARSGYYHAQNRQARPGRAKTTPARPPVQGGLVGRLYPTPWSHWGGATLRLLACHFLKWLCWHTTATHIRHQGHSVLHISRVHPFREICLPLSL